MDSRVFGGWFMHFTQYLLNLKSRKCFYYHFLILKIGICISLLLKSKDRPFLCAWSSPTFLMVRLCPLGSWIPSFRSISARHNCWDVLNRKIGDSWKQKSRHEECFQPNKLLNVYTPSKLRCLQGRRGLFLFWSWMFSRAIFHSQLCCCLRGRSCFERRKLIGEGLLKKAEDCYSSCMLTYLDSLMSIILLFSCFYCANSYNLFFIVIAVKDNCNINISASQHVGNCICHALFLSETEIFRPCSSWTKTCLFFSLFWGWGQKNRKDSVMWVSSYVEEGWYDSSYLF